MVKLSWRVAPLSLVVLTTFVLSTTQAAEKSITSLLPPTSVVYLEIEHPAKLIDVVFQHPLRARTQSLESYQAAAKTPDFEKFLFGVSAIEGGLDMKLDEALKKFSAGGIHAVVDAKTEGVALLIKAEDQETLQKLHSTVVGFINLSRDQQDEGKPPIRSGEYRGLKVHTIGEAKFTLLDDTLLITNKSELGKWIVDSWMDGRDKSLAENERFQAARRSRPDSATAWLYLDVASLREAGVAKGLFREKSDNPAIEALLGGMLETARQTPYMTASLHIEKQRVALALATPFEKQWIGEARQYYFGPDGNAPAPPLLKTPETLFSLSAYRDLSEMWLRAGDLFDDNVNDELAKANSNLTTLFAGKDFGEEILGAIKGPLQFLAVRQRFSKEKPTPEIKLPAFALVAQLKNPDKMRGELRRTFQSLIGFLNVTGAMNGQPQLDLDMQTEKDRQLVTATYVPAADDDDPSEINFNFSPSIGFVGDRVIIASSSQLARDLTGMKPAAGKSGNAPNTAARLDAAVLRSILEDNRQHLVAQNMLEQGNDKEEAERQIGDLLSILDFFDGATLRMGAQRQQLELELELKLKVRSD